MEVWDTGQLANIPRQCPESDIEEDHDEETRKNVGEPEDEFDGEDGEEPWGVDEYTAEGYARP